MTRSLGTSEKDLCHFKLKYIVRCITMKNHRINLAVMEIFSWLEAR